MAHLAVAIPTYRRPHLLALLLRDLMEQTVKPAHIIIIDGDPDSGAVYEMLCSIKMDETPILYLPSNHGNLSYQRYLGWRVAADLDADILVYFDDDERIKQRNVLALLTAPLESAGVVGVGCHIQFGEACDGSDASSVRKASKKSFLVRLFGNGKNMPPGGLTPTGNRKMPINDEKDFVETTWLRGGVMAYQMSAISVETFSADLFALDHIRCGLGEDTFLSRRVGARGKLLYTYRAIVEHPNADSPKSYPHDVCGYAYAAAYSRRFLNDYYRVYEPPTVSDRWRLVKSYAGKVLLEWMRVLARPNKLRFAMALGTTLGALHGLTRPPNAKRLTPEIDWWVDAEKALRYVQVI